jgi:chromate reductase
MTAEQNPLQVLLFAGSLRKNSLNKKLIELVGEAVGNYGAKAQIMDVQAYDCPSFNEDAESTDNIPAGASLLVEHILAADAIIIAAPEYNGSFPGFLKNILDWVSRYRPQPLYQKQMLLISASPSMGGGNRGLWNLRMPFEHIKRFGAF